MVETEVTWTGEGLGFTASTARGELLVRPTSDGTKQAFGPKELVAIGLGGCTGMDVVSILEKMRAAPTTFSVKVEGETAATHPERFERMTVHFRAEGNATPDQVRRAVGLSLTRYCGVAATLAGVAEIVPRITLNGQDVEAPIVRAFPQQAQANRAQEPEPKAMRSGGA